MFAGGKRWIENQVQTRSARVVIIIGERKGGDRITDGSTSLAALATPSSLVKWLQLDPAAYACCAPTE
jgi:hypothetical protein